MKKKFILVIVILLMQVGFLPVHADTYKSRDKSYEEYEEFVSSINQEIKYNEIEKQYHFNKTELKRIISEFDIESFNCNFSNSFSADSLFESISSNIESMSKPLLTLRNSCGTYHTIDRYTIGLFYVEPQGIR